MKVLMFLHSLNPAAGVEQYVVSILPELRRFNIETIFCIEQPPEADNQYYRQLRANGFDVHYPRIGPFPVRGWSWPVEIALLLLFPVTIILTLYDMLARGRSWNESYSGLRGRLNNITMRWRPGWTVNVPVWTLLTWLWLWYRPSVIHILRVDSVAALQWSIGLKLPTIYTEALEPEGYIHYPQLAASYQKLERLASQISVIVTQSERVRSSIQRNWNVGDNVRILPWVVTVPLSNDKVHTHDRSREIVFGSAGRLSSEKNIETFLDAAKLLVTDYSDYVKFIIAGGGPAEDSLKAYAQLLGIENCTHFTGLYTAEMMPAIFGLFDVFIISSLTEGAPLAVIEAMAYGKPVIATDIAGTGELVVDGITGFLVQSRDPQGIAAACRVFIRNSDLGTAMGRAAHERYRQYYTPEAGAQKLCKLYTELCST